MRTRSSMITPALLGFLLLVVSLPASAATGTVSPFISAFTHVATGWYTEILKVSKEIFYFLFGVDFVYLVAQWLIGGKDVHEIFTSFLKKILSIGVFYFILLNSQQLLKWVFQGFHQTGVQAGGAHAVGVSAIFNTLMQIWNALLKGPKTAHHGWLYDITHFGSAALSDVLAIMMAGICSLIVLMIMVYVVIEYFAVKLEAVLVGSVGALMLGFAGSRWTVQYAEGFFKYAVSVGVRLLVLTLWIGFVETQLGTSITRILNIASHNGTNVVGQFEGYGEILIFFLLVGWLTKKLPSIANSVLAGSSSLSGGDLVAAGATAAALGAAAVATGGAALAGAGAAGGAGALTGAQAAAMDAGAAGSLSGAAGGGMEMAGSSGLGAGAMDTGMAHAVQPPPPPPPPKPAGVQPPPFPSAAARVADMAPQEFHSTMADAVRTGMQSDRPMSLAERFRKYHRVATGVHAHGEKVLSPGEAPTNGVQAPGAGLKHSE